MTEWDKYGDETKIVLLDLEYGDSGAYKYLCSEPHGNDPIVLSDKQYLPHVLSVGSITHSVEAIEGGGQVASCTVTIQNISGEYYTFRDTYKTKNRSAIIYVAFESDISGTRQEVFRGKVQSDDIDDEAWTITLEDSFGKHDKTLPLNLYDTETYPNLEEGAAGTPIPYGFGEIKKAIATEIDTVTHKYKISDLAIKQFDGIHISNGIEEKKRENGFKIQYTGAAATALLAISDSNKLTVITAGSVDDLSYDLTNASYDTLTELVAAIDGEGNYACTLDADGDTDSTDLRELYDVDIKTAVTQIELAGNIYADVTSQCSTDAANGEFTLSLDAFDIQYSNGAASANLNISESGRLIVITTGDVDNLDIDLTDIRYRTMSKLVDEIHGTANYTCTIDTANEAQSIMLKPVFNVDIKTASTQITLSAPEKGTVVVDFQGAKDDGSGTYTGVADALIERPCDIAHYIMRSICGMAVAEINTTDFTAARDGAWKGFTFGNYITGLVSSFELVSQISTEAYAWCYQNNYDGKLTWKNKEGDDEEAIDNYYYESGQFPRIYDEFSKQASIRDLWNKIEINYGYIFNQNSFAKSSGFENTHSQSETVGYGTTNTYKKDCYWIPKDVVVASIQYTGTGTCTVTITGSDDDESIYFSTSVTGGGSETEFNLNLEGSSQDALSELIAIVNGDGDYTMTVEDAKYNTLKSIGLSDLSTASIDSSTDLTFNFAKLLGLNMKRRYSILMDTVTFNTSLFGFKQSLAKPIKVKSIKEGSDKRFRVTGIDGNPDSFDVSVTAEYEPLCNCFNQCYSHSDCTCDQACHSFQACVSCDDTCYEEASGCTCNSACYQYEACTCDSTCYEEGTTCTCDSTCYGYSACSCNNTCYQYNCACHSTCYNDSCHCDNTCYFEEECSCYNTCYADQGGICGCDLGPFDCYSYTTCGCDNLCYGETCTCEYTTYGWQCTCQSTCYAYSGCSCNATCYEYVACQCDQTCYLFQACQSCDISCYEEATGCSCNGLCYQYSCGCDELCYSEETPCSCDYTVYE